MRIPTTTSSLWPTVLLELTVQGVKYFYTDGGPVSVSSDDGDVLFHPGLETVALSWSIDLFGTADSKTVSVSVDLGAGVILATLFGAGRSLYTATARLLVYFGGALEDAIPMASGSLRDPIYGDPAIPSLFSFSIERDTIDHALIPSINNTVKEDSWDSLASNVWEDDLGKPRMILIGKPGYDLRSIGDVIKTVPTTIGRLQLSPAPSQTRIELCAGQILASSVKLWSANNKSSGTADVTYDIDDLGYLVSFADMSTYSGTFADLHADPPFFAGFSTETHPGPFGQGFRGLGDVVLWALSQASFADSGVDWDMVHSMVDKLNLLGRIDTWISERVSPYEWLKGEVLAHFPCYVADSGKGVYVGIWPFDAEPALVEFVINTSLPGFERISPMVWSQPSLGNHITIESQYSAATSKYMRYRQITGNPDAIEESWPGAATSTADTTLVRHPALEESFRMFGLAELDISVPTVSDPATLGRIAQYRANRHALPTAEVGYLIPWRRGIPALGGVVSVTDALLGLDGTLGVLTGIRLKDGQCEARVSLLPIL